MPIQKAWWSCKLQHCFNENLEKPQYLHNCGFFCGKNGFRVKFLSQRFYNGYEIIPNMA